MKIITDHKKHELEAVKSRVKEAIQAELNPVFEIARYLYENPELGYEEVKACERLCAAFEQYGFAVEKGIYDIPTAFQAVYDSGKKGPTIAFCAEYDALPEIGHGCGHNLICTMALAAAAGLKTVLPEIGGRVIVLGTPAEETSGAKVLMAEKGAFDGADVALMAHPSSKSEESGSSLAMTALQFQFFGKAAHAAAAPEMGINALDGVIQLFNGINALRQHMPKDVLFHGIISHGGAAPNIVPDFAEARFYIRAAKKSTVAWAVEKVHGIAEGAALMTGARVEISNFELSYDDLNTNQMLNQAVAANQAGLGDTVLKAQEGHGSLDLGNVSYVVPCVHAWIGFNDPSLVVHTREFADRTVSPRGKEILFTGACTLAFSACDVILQPDLLSEIKREFRETVKGQSGTF